MSVWDILLNFVTRYNLWQAVETWNLVWRYGTIFLVPLCEMTTKLSPVLAQGRGASRADVYTARQMLLSAHRVVLLPLPGRAACWHVQGSLLAQICFASRGAQGTKRMHRSSLSMEPGWDETRLGNALLRSHRIDIASISQSQES